MDNIFSWIDKYIDFYSSLVGAAIRNAIRWAVHGLAGIVHTLFVHVAGAELRIFDGANWILRHTAGFANSVVAWIRQIVTVDIPALWHYAISNVRQLLRDISAAANWLLGKIETLARVARRWVDDAVSWIVTHVYDPLKAYADTIWRDLLKWGYFAWKLLNDPPRLAAILLNALIAAAEAAFWTIAPPAGRFALGLVLHNARRFAQLLETILAAVI